MRAEAPYSHLCRVLVRGETTHWGIVATRTHAAGAPQGLHISVRGSSGACRNWRPYPHAWSGYGESRSLRPRLATKYASGS